MGTPPHARTRAAELAWALATVALTCILAVVALRLWNAALRVPFAYNGDANQNQLFIKSVLDHGWYQHNPDLGAPFGQVLYDFPVLSGDNAQVVLIKLLGLFTSDSALAMNLFFLLTFPLTALIAFAVLRRLEVSPPAAMVAAVLFALAPYRFLRGEYHLWIATYYAVPLSAYLVVNVLRGRWRMPRGRALVGCVALCAVIGSTHVYYAAFAILLLAIAAGLRLVAGDRDAATAGIVLVLLIGAVAGLNHLPNALYRAQHGVNHSLARPAAESEDYGLKIDQMLLPVPGHRVAALARLRDRYDRTATGQLREGQTQALGVVGGLGLVVLLIVALLSVAVPRGRLDPRLRVFAVATTAAVLLATVGGFSGVIAYLVTPQLRAWARMSIFIEFFALAAVAVLADQLAIRRGMRVGGAVLATLLVIGFLDQTNAGSVPEYAATAARYRSDAALVKTLEAKLPRGARVFELPYEPFPEPQPAFAPPDLGPYDMARPYLHSHHLRWSYGLMKGRAGDWQAALVALPPALVARALVAAGFSGIYVDRGGYADGAAYVVNALSEATGAQPISSPDGRLAFVDLRAFGRNLQASRAGALPSLRRAVLRPLTITYPGLSALRQTAEGRSYLTGQTGEISVENPGPAPRTAVFAARLASATSGQATVVLTFPGPGQRPLRIVVDARGKPLQRRLELPPGVTRITLSVRGRAQFGFPLTTRPYYLRVQDPLLVDSAFQPLGTLPADRRAASFLSPFGPI